MRTLANPINEIRVTMFKESLSRLRLTRALTFVFLTTVISHQPSGYIDAYPGIRICSPGNILVLSLNLSSVCGFMSTSRYPWDSRLKSSNASIANLRLEPYIWRARTANWLYVSRTLEQRHVMRIETYGIRACWLLVYMFCVRKITLRSLWWETREQHGEVFIQFLHLVV
jgi:hypothetical protein